ncbi:MAG: hypothetical protein AB1796_05555 [Bacillota bacterium]
MWFLNYDVRNDYLHKTEMLWMFAGNALYYLIAVPLAFIFKDRRAFCKLVCPVPVVMKPPAAVALITIAPSGKSGRVGGIYPRGRGLLVAAGQQGARGE